MKEYEAILHVAPKGSIIDLEATEECVFTSGCIVGDKLKIWQLEDDSREEREKMAQQLLQVAEFPKPIYFMGQKDEGKKWIKGDIDLDLNEYWLKLGEQFRPPEAEWCEECGWMHIGAVRGGLCPQCGSRVREVMREFQLRPTAFAPRGLGPPGKEGGTGRLWKEYLKTKESLYLFIIALKTQADLLSGCCLIAWRSMGLPLEKVWYEI